MILQLSFGPPGSEDIPGGGAPPTIGPVPNPQFLANLAFQLKDFFSGLPKGVKTGGIPIWLRQNANEDWRFALVANYYDIFINRGGVVSQSRFPDGMNPFAYWNLLAQLFGPFPLAKPFDPVGGNGRRIPVAGTDNGVVIPVPPTNIRTEFHFFVPGNPIDFGVAGSFKGSFGVALDDTSPSGDITLMKASATQGRLDFNFANNLKSQRARTISRLIDNFEIHQSTEIDRLINEFVPRISTNDIRDASENDVITLRDLCPDMEVNPIHIKQDGFMDGFLDGGPLLPIPGTGTGPVDVNVMTEVPVNISTPVSVMTSAEGGMASAMATGGNVVINQVPDAALDALLLEETMQLQEQRTSASDNRTLLFVALGAGALAILIAASQGKM